jgi:putative SOS response-associated peptidase YedK
MWGRFTNLYSWQELRELYSLTDQDMIASNFLPRYNIAPTQLSLVIRETNGRRELEEMRWGLLPSWTKSPSDDARMINARASRGICEWPETKWHKIEIGHFGIDVKVIYGKVSAKLTIRWTQSTLQLLIQSP